MTEMTTIKNLPQIHVEAIVSIIPSKIKYNQKEARKMVEDYVNKTRSIAIVDEKGLKALKAEINKKIDEVEAFLIAEEKKAILPVKEFRKDIREDLQPLIDLANELSAEFKKGEKERIAQRNKDIEEIVKTLESEYGIKDPNPFNPKWHNKTMKLEEIHLEIDERLKNAILARDACIANEKARVFLVEKLNAQYNMFEDAAIYNVDAYSDEQVEKIYADKHAKIIAHNKMQEEKLAAELAEKQSKEVVPAPTLEQKPQIEVAASVKVDNNKNDLFGVWSYTMSIEASKPILITIEIKNQEDIENFKKIFSIIKKQNISFDKVGFKKQ